MTPEPDTFRSKEWAPLSEMQKADIKAIKTLAEQIEDYTQKNIAPGRLRSIAETNLETAIMFYVKAVTE